MKATICIAALVVIALILASAGRSDDRSPSDDVARLAATIDEHIARRWADEKVTPAPLADDAEFLRRVYLDIAGKIPAVSEVRAFSADTSTSKRREVVDRLLDGPAYIVHFTNVWRAAMMPEANADIQVQYLIPSFEAWLRKKLTDEASYADIVREILTLPLDARQGMNPYQQTGEPTPVAFYQAKQIQPESLAAATSRIFLGVRIECAECHNHPFDAWKQEQFWSYAAFYAGIERSGANNVFGPVREIADRRELAIPKTDRIVQAAFLDGTEPQWRFRVGARATLADWMISAENRYFSRAVANRFWAHFFGIGLVDPADDFSVNNPPSHPELLDELARQFAAHNFDLKFLIRAITASRSYQLTSAVTDPSQDDPLLFAKMSVKGLTPEQLFDSLAQAIGLYQPFNARNQFISRGESLQSEFLQTFTNDSDTPTQRQTSILQALAMMNGPLTSAATSLESSQTLSAVASYPRMDTAGRIETLYLATLSRKPREDELAKLTKFVDSGGPTNDSKKALSDVFWALLNSSEFMFNH